LPQNGDEARNEKGSAAVSVEQQDQYPSASVRVGKPTFAGEDRYGRAFVVEAKLAPTPDREWGVIFGRLTRYPHDLPEPQLTANGVLSASVTEETLEPTWQALQERVEATNAAYVEHVIPQRERERNARERERRAADERLARRRELVDALEHE
jgi:hypothetical protein